MFLNGRRIREWFESTWDVEMKGRGRSWWWHGATIKMIESPSLKVGCFAAGPIALASQIATRWGHCRKLHLKRPATLPLSFFLLVRDLAAMPDPACSSCSGDANSALGTPERPTAARGTRIMLAPSLQLPLQLRLCHGS